MFKSELPLLFPDDADVKAVAEAMFDPFEYFVLRNRDGLFKKDFKQPLGKVSYHIPCHARVQNIGQKTRELLELLPGTQVNTVERCSGHDGTWGVKTEYFANSMKIGRPVFKAMAGTDPDYISSDCPIAGRHIEQGIGDDARAARSTRSRCSASPTGCRSGNDRQREDRARQPALARGVRQAAQRISRARHRAQEESQGRARRATWRSPSRTN